MVGLMGVGVVVLMLMVGPVVGLLGAGAGLYGGVKHAKWGRRRLAGRGRGGGGGCGGGGKLCGRACRRSQDPVETCECLVCEGMWHGSEPR